MQHTDNGAHWHEQQLFYHVIQPGKNNINARFGAAVPLLCEEKRLKASWSGDGELTEDF
jgi:cellulose synthase (UDP-forming)